MYEARNGPTNSEMQSSLPWAEVNGADDFLAEVQDRRVLAVLFVMQVYLLYKWYELTNYRVWELPCMLC